MDITTALARQILDKSNFTANDVASSLQGEMALQGALSPIWDRVYSEVVDLEPSVLGIIAATGRATLGDEYSVGVSLYQVHSGTWLGKRDSGLTLLHTTACTALVARMADLAKEPIASSR